MQKAKPQIEDLKKQVEELKNNWQRALADYQNLEKRVTAEKKEFIAWANSNLIANLLPFLDSLKKAEEHLRDSGLSLAVRQLEGILEEAGLVEIEVLGKEFNPEEAECIGAIPGKEENKVEKIVRLGYKLNGRVLRPVQVIVAKNK